MHSSLGGGGRCVASARRGRKPCKKIRDCGFRPPRGRAMVGTAGRLPCVSSTNPAFAACRIAWIACAEHWPGSRRVRRRRSFRCSPISRRIRPDCQSTAPPLHATRRCSSGFDEAVRRAAWETAASVIPVSSTAAKANAAGRRLELRADRCQPVRGRRDQQHPRPPGSPTQRHAA